jgi:methylated-DNA-protein-cysteine methyltransferase-like protein
MYKTMQGDTINQKIYTLLASIPTGRVTTYGEIAKRLDMPRSARLVGRILSQLPKNTELPWYRVVNAKGNISLPRDSSGYSAQIAKLQEEGVEVINGRIRLQKYAWGL